MSRTRPWLLLTMAAALPCVLNFLPSYVRADEVGVARAVEIWSNKSGVKATDEVTADFTQTIANKSASTLAGSGFQHIEAVDIAKALAGGGSIIDTKSFVAVKYNSETIYKTDDPKKSAVLLSVFSSDSVSNVISKFPTIKIIVVPSPPVDYTIEINGKRYSPTERNEYCTRAGNVTVKVVRSTNPPCQWAGNMGEGEKQEVSCKF